MKSNRFRFRGLIFAIVMIFGEQLAANAEVVSQISDKLTGARTVKSFSLPLGISYPGERMDISVETQGNGNNQLTVKVQYTDGFGWITLEQLIIPAGATRHGTFVVPAGKTIRLRFSRTAATRKIVFDTTIRED
ncbi:MAG: hypothetical protein AAF585_21950 [Verrucomicrobiota bacterium]